MEELQVAFEEMQYATAIHNDISLPTKEWKWPSADEMQKYNDTMKESSFFSWNAEDFCGSGCLGLFMVQKAVFDPYCLLLFTHKTTVFVRYCIVLYCIKYRYYVAYSTTQTITMYSTSTWPRNGKETLLSSFYAALYHFDA